MKRFPLWCLALAGAAVVVLAAPATRADEEKVIIEKRPMTTTTTYHYVYYPESEVYFVPEKRVYFIREGETFRSVREVPSGIKLGTSVNLDVDQPDPWTRHEVIVKKYGGKHGKFKSKETFKDDEGNERTRETIREKDGDVIIKEKSEKDND